MAVDNLKQWNYLQYQKILCTESFSDQNIITGVGYFDEKITLGTNY